MILGILSFCENFKFFCFVHMRKNSVEKKNLNRRVEARFETKTKQAQGTFTAWTRATRIALPLSRVTT